MVGLGYWGPNVVRSAHDAEGVGVVMGCDHDRSALQRQIQRYPAISFTTSFDEVLANDDVNGVVLATPIATHFELARRVLMAGKHVLVEKPLANTPAECRQLAELAEERGLVIMPGHTFLYSPPVVAVKDLLDSGELGRVHFITSSRVNLGIHQRDNSVIRDLAPHDFSILLYWLGGPVSIGRSAETRSSPGWWTWPSSTSATATDASPIWTFRGSHRRSCGGPSWCASGRWWSTRTRTRSRCASSTAGSR